VGVKITGLDQQLSAVMNEVASSLGKEAHNIANNMGSQIALKASSGRTRYTPAVSAAKVRADLNRPIGNWGRRILRMKHGLAIKTLKSYGRGNVNWPNVRQEADRIVKIRQSSRSFLRSGFIWPGHRLGIAAGKFGRSGNRNARGFSSKGPSSGNRRSSRVRVATKGRPVAVIENVAADISARRAVPDYKAAVFERGSPSRMRSLGQAGLNKAARDQIQFEKRTLPIALERKIAKSIKRGERIASRIRGASSLLS